MKPGVEGYCIVGLLCSVVRVVVKALVADLAVEAFDGAVLHGLARFDQGVLDPMLLCPGDEDTTGKLRTVVGTHRMRIRSTFPSGFVVSLLGL